MTDFSRSRYLWILEDDVALRTVMSSLAREEGFAVLELDSIQKSGALLAETTDSHSTSFGREPIGILSDFHLPDGDAEEFLLQCRIRFSQVPIYCVSGHLPLSQAHRMERAGIQVLWKPLQLSEMLGILNKISGR